MDSFISEAVKEAARGAATRCYVKWNEGVSAHAAEEIARAACAVQLAEIERTLREGEEVLAGTLVIQHHKAADFVRAAFGDPETEASHEAAL